MTEQVIANLVRMVSDGSRAFNKRLEHSALLSTMPDCDEACVSLLDTLAPRTPFGHGYREVLVTVGVSVDALCVLLWETPTFQRAAVDRLGELGASNAVPDLVSLLSTQLHSEDRDRELILRTLDAIGACCARASSSAPEAVAAAIGDKDGVIRTVAAATLRRMGSQAASASPTLLQLLGSDDARVRFEVAELLPELTGPETYIPHMVRLMHEESDELIRWVARYELSRLPCPSQEIEAALAA